MINTALTDMRVGLSGAVPEPDRLAEVDLTESTFLEAVDHLCRRVLGAGGRLVHGCHPSIVPTLAACAREEVATRSEPPVILLLGRSFNPSQAALDEFIDGQKDYAEVVEIGELDWDAARSLDALRDALAARVDALVCVGGKARTAIGGRPGVEVEVERVLAMSQEREARRQKPIPIYLPGALGGATRDLWLGRFASGPAALRNGLTSEQNSALTLGGWPAAIDLVVEGLLRTSVLPPP